MRFTTRLWYNSKLNLLLLVNILKGGSSHGALCGLFKEVKIDSWLAAKLTAWFELALLPYVHFYRMPFFVVVALTQQNYSLALLLISQYSSASSQLTSLPPYTICSSPRLVRLPSSSSQCHRNREVEYVAKHSPPDPDDANVDQVCDGFAISYDCTHPPVVVITTLEEPTNVDPSGNLTC